MSTPANAATQSRGTYVTDIVEYTRKPMVIEHCDVGDVLCLPDGYHIENLDKLLIHPKRKSGSIATSTAASFIDVAKRYGSPATCNIYVYANYENGDLTAVAVFNDHADGDGLPGWRDHRAVFTPSTSAEWQRWIERNKAPCVQDEFAGFLEANAIDIAGGDGLPSSADVLEFVSRLEETRTVKYGSAVNLQNGLVQIEFIEQGDDAQRGKLDVFKRFRVALRLFQGGDTYAVEALLRYRIDRNSGTIKFWYELQRLDRVIEDVCRDTVEKIVKDTGLPVIFGTP